MVVRLWVSSVIDWGPVWDLGLASASPQCSCDLKCDIEVVFILSTER